MSILIPLLAIALTLYWLKTKDSPRPRSTWKRVKGFTELCQRAPGVDKAEVLALLEFNKARWRGKAYAVERALYLLEKDRK